jgi:RNA polymerase sigma-70 factor (ECF subfamily)
VLLRDPFVWAVRRNPARGGDPTGDVLVAAETPDVPRPVLDPEGFRAFYDVALPRVYGYFLHRCGGRVNVAEDLTQETFMAAVRELRKQRRVEAGLPWIYGIARHKLLDHYRAEERARKHVAADDDADEVPDPMLVDADVENRALTAAALAAVAPQQRAALVLCYVDGLTMAEAGAALGKSAEAVESLLARGRRAFKRAYLEAAR